MAKICNFFKDESGASMVEYGLLLALIAVVCIVTLGLLGGNLNKIFQAVDASLKPAT